MPEQRDPLEQLNQFGAGFSTGASGGPMPHSAAEARQRGDQIRRRRSALVAGGAALAVAAVAVPIIAIAGGTDAPDIDRDNIATSPSARPTVLSTDDLLVDGETAYTTWGDWREDETFEGDGQATTFECQRQALSGIGATGAFNRTWNFAVEGEVNTDPSSPRLVEEIAEFADADAARAAYETVTGWVEDCSGIGEADEVRHLQTRPVDIVGGEGAIVELQATPAPAAVDPFGDAAYINETGIVLVDDRIAVVGLTIIGQDYNFLEEEGGTPMQRMLPVAAERLLPGANVPVLPDPVVDAAGGGGVDGSEPDAAGFPDGLALDAGWDFDPQDYEVTGPSETGASLVDGAFTLGCGEDLTMDAVARQTVQVSGPTQGYGREVWSFGDPDAASSALQDVVARYVDCEVDAAESSTTFDVSPSDVGDESYRVVRQTLVGGSVSTESTQVWWAGRFGSVVLLMTGTEEGGGTIDAGNALLDGLVADAQPVIGVLQGS